MSLIEELVQRLEARKVGNYVCFFCANEYSSSSITLEHIFSKWLQNKFDLWDMQLNLPNGTPISYRHLVVPCCNICNTKYLSVIEREVKNVCENGYKAVNDYKMSIYFWLSKIWYGLIYKELFLPYDREFDDFDTIANEKFINQYSLHLQFMQAARDEIELYKCDPFSLFSFECQETNEPKGNFDYVDDEMVMVSGIRMGKVGLIIVFQDGGAQQPFDKYLYEEAPYPLHPIQFRELCAKVIYKEHIRDRTPKFISIAGEYEKPKYFQLPLYGFSLKPFYKEWDFAVYAKVLAHYTGVNFNDVYFSDDRVTSWLVDGNGKPIFIPV